MKIKLLAIICLMLLPLGCGDSRGEDTASDQGTFHRGIRDASVIPEITPDNPDSQSTIDAGSQSDTSPEPDVSSPSDTGLEPIVDLTSAGPHDVQQEERSAIVTGCTMSYKVYSPIGAEEPPVVILGHGFARGASVMVNWATHLSSWGVEVLLPTLCHFNILAGVNHELNGQNMTELADIHTTNDVVYAGHSAGGLAAIIAASQDVGALGVLGLDATDTQGVPGVPDAIGYVFAATVTCPAFAIVGEPSSCNSNNNGISLFRAMSTYRIARVRSSDHCDFESPTNFVCESSCQNETTDFSDYEIRSVITTLGTSAILSLTGLSETNWTDEMMSSDLVQGLD